MLLSGGLSNHPSQDLLQCLTGHTVDNRPPRKDPCAGSADGRRKFGTVCGAIVSVLAQADAEMHVRAIHAGVEHVLDGSVSFYSVADYLLRRSKGRSPLFIRARLGYYRLLRGADDGLK